MNPQHPNRLPDSFLTVAIISAVLAIVIPGIALYYQPVSCVYMRIVAMTVFGLISIGMISFVISGCMMRYDVVRVRL